MDKDYIEVKIPILDSVDEMKVVKTFTQEQLWYVCAIAKAFEKSEQQIKNQQEVIDKAIDQINYYKSNCGYNGSTTIHDKQLDELQDILKEVSE